MAEEQKKSKTISLGVNIDTDLKKTFKKRCKELRYKERDVVESLLQLFLNLEDENAQSRIVRGEAKIMPNHSKNDGLSGRILSGIKSIML